MNATLTALNGFLLALTWHAEQGITYTVQTSGDLINWMSLPMVFSSEGIQTLALEALPSPVFARLRYASDGDTNDNGLPDLWEWQQFGYIDVDASGDPDEDGMSTYTEWINGTDPQDFFNGAKPQIHLSCGTDWIVPANEVSVQSVSLVLQDSAGVPLPDAPVHLRLQSASSGILQQGDPLSSAVSEVIAYTDSLGRIHPASHAIHYVATATRIQEEVLIIEAGNDSAEIRIHVVPGQINGPPRRLKQETIDGGTVLYTWTGSASDARRFTVEQQDSSGEWSLLVELAAQDIPNPDAATGEYSLLTEAP
jgi:hypothetical protein